jgi:single-strand DNA-binding protein
MAIPLITLSGARVVGKPKFKLTPAGMPVLQMRLAAADRRQDPDGTWHDGEEYQVTATAFKDLAENIRDSIHAGDMIICSGRLKTDQWKDQHGNTKTVDKLILNDCGPSLKLARRRHEHVVLAEARARAHDLG